MVTRIYTRTGDTGSTGLLGGVRVSKDDVRVAAYGTVDELSAAIGLAVACGLDEETAALLAGIQATIFELGAQLATPDPASRLSGIGDSDIGHLEAAIDSAEAELEPLNSFILPGGSAGAASLHVARGVCRRAERACVTLMASDLKTPKEPLIYLNRLSDLLFVLARRVNHRVGVKDTPWHPRAGSPKS